MNDLLQARQDSHGSGLKNKLTVNANGVQIDRNFPTSIDFCLEREELIISTKTDIRLIDSVTGNTKRILAIDDSEITKCLVYFDNNQIIGKIRIHCVTT